MVSDQTQSATFLHIPSTQCHVCPYSKGRPWIWQDIETDAYLMADFCGYLGSPRESDVFHVNLDTKPSLRLLQSIYHAIEWQIGTSFSLGNIYMYKW